MLRRQARTLLAGQLTRPVEVVPRGEARVAGAHLRPCGAYDLLCVPQHRYRNQIVDLRTIDPSLANALARHVVPRQDARGMVDALADVLAARATTRTSHCPAANAVRTALALRGMIGVAELARLANVSARHLERLFHQRVGISPKLFVRIVRFQEALRATRAGGARGWPAIALEHGFYDQSHFINDFKSFVGCSPAAWKISDDSLAAIFSAVRRPRADRVAFFQDRQGRMA